MGVKANLMRISEEKGHFLDFSGAVRALRKRSKRQKKAEKGGFRPISRKGSQTPFVTPPFAASQTIAARMVSENAIARRTTYFFPGGTNRTANASL